MNRFDRSIDTVEWVHHLLDIGLIHFREKVLNSVLILQIVEHYEPLSWCSHKCGDKPLIELVDNLKVHIWSAQHVLVQQVERGVGDELVKVAVVILPDLTARGRELDLKQWIVIVANNHEVISSRHILFCNSKIRLSHNNLSNSNNNIFWGGSISTASHKTAAQSPAFAPFCPQNKRRQLNKILFYKRYYIKWIIKVGGLQFRPSYWVTIAKRILKIYNTPGLQRSKDWEPLRTFSKTHNCFLKDFKDI